MKKLSLFICLIAISQAFAQSFDDKKLQTFNGYFNFFYEESNDKIYLEVKDLEKEFLYVFAIKIMTSLKNHSGKIYSKFLHFQGKLTEF